MMKKHSQNIVRLALLVGAALMVFLVGGKGAQIRASETMVQVVSQDTGVKGSLQKRKSGKKAVSKKRDIQLIMFDQPFCEYCELWEEQVGVTYPKTVEGKFAPLKRVHISKSYKDYKIRGVVYTPTFVVIEDGREIGRLVGYINEDFFWTMLAPLLKKVGFGTTQETRS